MFFLHSITVTVNKRTIDRNGDWSVVSSFRLSGCAISQASKTRSYGTQTFEQESLMGITILFAPSGSDIEESDTITLDDGTVWHVWGFPTDFQSPFSGWMPGMQVPLRHFEG